MNTEKLNEKDLLCIALHLVEFTDVWLKNDDQAEPACVKCHYAISDKCTGTKIMDPWQTFMKLGRITGVGITQFCNERQRVFIKESIAQGIITPLSDEQLKLWLTNK